MGLLTVFGSYLSNFSDNFKVAVLLWPILALLLCLPVLVALYRRDGWLQLSTMFVVYASILYVAGLACFTLYPLPTGDSGPGITYGIPPILNPLNFVHDISTEGVRAVLQLLFNIALFVPFGFIAKLLLKLKFLPTAALSFAASLLIEVSQLTGLFGIYPFSYRTFDVDDLICNTLGGIAGWALGSLFTKLVFKGSSQVPPITHSPGFGRRAVTLLTDLMIIDVCCVVPRMMIIVGAQLATGDAASIAGIPLGQFNEIASTVCLLIAFAVIEIVIPWRHGGCTPAGMFYRMSCETRNRTGIYRATFYAARSITLLGFILFPRYLAIPLLLFYAIARKMPYDFIPSERHSKTDARATN